MEKQKEAIASLETRIKELESANLWNASPEVTVGAGVSDVSRSELEATQASLAEAMAKIEEDEHIVVKWEGTLLFCLMCVAPVLPRAHALTHAVF